MAVPLVWVVVAVAALAAAWVVAEANLPILVVAAVVVVQPPVVATNAVSVGLVAAFLPAVAARVSVGAMPLLLQLVVVVVLLLLPLLAVVAIVAVVRPPFWSCLTAASRPRRSERQSDWRSVRDSRQRLC